MSKKRETRPLEMSGFQNFVKIFGYANFNNKVNVFIPRLKFKNLFPSKNFSQFRVKFNIETPKPTLKTLEDTRRK